MATSTRKDRLDALKKAVDEYAETEKKRIENEVAVLDKVLSGRAGGGGVQTQTTAAVSRSAYNDLASYLKGT